MVKKILLITALSGFLFSGVAQAQTSDLPDPGLLPNHPLYFLKSWGEAVGTFFTLGDVAKAGHYLLLAERRLAEAKALTDKDKPEAAERVLERHQEQLDRSLEVAERAKDKGLDIDEVLAEVAEATLRHQTVLVKIYEKVPAKARPAIERAIERSMKGHERALQAISKEKREQISEQIEEKRRETLQKTEEIRKKVPEMPVELPGVVCPMIYDPVCGVDGRTYGNRCVAEQIQGIEMDYEGACEP